MPVRIIPKALAGHCFKRKAEGVGDVQLSQGRIFEQYAGVLKALSARKPLVLVLDDLHFGDLPSLQLIDAALEPARKQFRPAALQTLGRALALVVGTEAMVVFKDVLRLDDAEARKVKRWAIRALVDAARK